MESISQKMFILGATSVSAIMIGTYLFKVAFGRSSSDENEVCFDDKIDEDETIGIPDSEYSISAANIDAMENTGIAENTHVIMDSSNEENIPDSQNIIFPQNLIVNNNLEAIVTPTKPASSDAPLELDVMESSVNNTNVFPSNSEVEQLVNSSEFQDTIIGFQDTNSLIDLNSEQTPLIDCSLQRFESRILGRGPHGSWFGIGNSSDSHLFFVIFLTKQFEHDSLNITNFVRFVSCLSQRRLKITHPEFLDEWKSGGVLSKVLAVDEFKILERFNEKAVANDVPSLMVGNVALSLGPTRVSDLKKILL